MTISQQLDQASANMDDRVPTPASVAETHSQTEFTAAVCKAEPEEGELDLENGKKPPELKTEVKSLRC